MKTIVVKWVVEEEFGYGKAMRVIESDHPRFTKGYRFDYGFFRIATDEGYTIISIPMEIQEKDFEKLEEISKSYSELIMAVQNKYPGENRHQTALRLISDAQQSSNQLNQSAQPIQTDTQGS